MYLVPKEDAIAINKKDNVSIAKRGRDVDGSINKPKRVISKKLPQSVKNKLRSLKAVTQKQIKTHLTNPNRFKRFVVTNKPTRRPASVSPYE